MSSGYLWMICVQKKGEAESFEPPFALLFRSLILGSPQDTGNQGRAIG